MCYHVVALIRLFTAYYKGNSKQTFIAICCWILVHLWYHQWGESFQHFLSSSRFLKAVNPPDASHRGSLPWCHLVFSCQFDGWASGAQLCSPLVSSFIGRTKRQRSHRTTDQLFTFTIQQRSRADVHFLFNVAFLWHPVETKPVSGATGVKGQTRPTYPFCLPHNGDKAFAEREAISLLKGCLEDGCVTQRHVRVKNQRVELSWIVKVWSQMLWCGKGLKDLA